MKITSQQRPITTDEIFYEAIVEIYDGNGGDVSFEFQYFWNGDLQEDSLYQLSIIRNTTSSSQASICLFGIELTPALLRQMADEVEKHERLAQGLVSEHVLFQKMKKQK